MATKYQVTLKLKLPRDAKPFDGGYQVTRNIKVADRDVAGLEGDALGAKLDELALAKLAPTLCTVAVTAAPAEEPAPAKAKAATAKKAKKGPKARPAASA